MHFIHKIFQESISEKSFHLKKRFFTKRIAMWGDRCISESDGGIWFTIYVYIKSLPCTLLKIQLVQPKYIQFLFMNHTSVKLGGGQFTHKNKISSFFFYVFVLI